MAKSPAQTPDGFMETLDHPKKAEAQALRDIIRSSAPDLSETLKWNAPSYMLGGDIRAVVDVRNADDLEHVGPLLPDLIRQWIAAVQVS